MPANLEYAGFWPRLAATLIDSILWCCFLFPALYWIYGAAYFSLDRTGMFAGPADVLLSTIFPALAAILFWRGKKATPGKLALRLSVVDAKTGNTLAVGQSIVRYVAYMVSILPFGMGFIWIIFDPRKQAWHDKIAGSVVVREKSRGPLPVQFSEGPATTRSPAAP
jgi:uncharacterized RDD family membrane protein YckC